ncbi:MAG: LysR family transcriptional regulator [Sediminimonas qiaohouensis]|uniref:LysR family transcriptional regulator n=1 Tax=Sediminimonas qiaohouensis TaxID=552061 RepID=A0A7C9HBF6_9RHOB|nr:LysR family transcriptional regulator [Sediminimonas qiaohouensis]MTJ05189.1 LysR family transcriptional regulator [Sediminimonas qiaohouensis]
MKITGTELHLLNVFNSVVRNSGMSAAQVELGLSQPTISNHITALEERLGVKLCQRGRRGFLLTEKGRIVHEMSQSLLATMAAHESKLAELRGSLVGHIKIAAVDCLISDPNFRLPEAIRAFVEAAPAVRVELTIERPQDILSGILDGSFDVGIGGFDNLVSGLDYQIIYHERHALYCGSPHVLFDQPDNSLTGCDYTGFAWAHRRYWSRRRQRGWHLSEKDTFVQEIEAQMALVLSGAFLGLLPEHAAHPHVKAGKLRRLPFVDPNLDVPINLVSRKGPRPATIDLFRKDILSLYCCK